jgi:hypothetical protein
MTLYDSRMNLILGSAEWAKNEISKTSVKTLLISADLSKPSS